MGLGKTIQGIASMSAFQEDWPLLVFTPSSARYHWQAEFIQWLGEEGPINQPKEVEEKLRALENDEEVDEDDVAVISKEPFRLLHAYEINVLRNGKSRLLHPKTRVVICSYGLAPSLVKNGLLRPGMFKSVIVDESHYLKSMKTKRTKSLIPILQHSNRCVLLSGTPALARPSELWPQLLALKGSDGGWWKNEADFYSKYVTRASAARRAELHTMLTGTLMIRRMKSDMLKNLPQKQREKALVNVTDCTDRREFHRCMELLRQGKGVMANIAQKHSAFAGMDAPIAVDNDSTEFLELKAEYSKRMEDEMRSVEQASESIEQNDASYDKENYARERKSQIQAELDIWYNQRLHEINQNAEIREDGGNGETSRKAVLNRMYGMTAKVKVPLIVDMLRQWLADPTKGKLCIFAHRKFSSTVHVVLLSVVFYC
jgi:SNF2 family DNA or RNA helicase